MGHRKESEFGKGYAYCLGLFLAHAERDSEQLQKPSDGGKYYAPCVWFYGASDHLFDLQIPKQLPKKRRDEIKAWHKKCMDFRWCDDGLKCTKKDVYEALDYAKQLLLEWDEYCNVPCAKGNWE